MVQTSSMSESSPMGGQGGLLSSQVWTRVLLLMVEHRDWCSSSNQIWIRIRTRSGNKPAHLEKRAQMLPVPAQEVGEPCVIPESEWREVCLTGGLCQKINPRKRLEKVKPERKTKKKQRPREWTEGTCLMAVPLKSAGILPEGSLISRYTSPQAEVVIRMWARAMSLQGIIPR